MRCVRITECSPYNTDRYGSTDPEIFDKRPSPEAFFAKERDYCNSDNEIMMRRGIPPEMIMALVMSDGHVKADLITRLNKVGVYEVNGVPLEKFIITCKNFGELRREAKKLPQNKMRRKK